MENFLISLAANEKFADIVISKIMDIYIENYTRIDDLDAGGGFVFAAVHNIQNDVPL